MKENDLSPSRGLATKVIFEAMKILTENGGEMRMTDILERIEQRVDLDGWAKGIYQKTGYVRWQSILHFFSIDCVKAGFLIKRKGVWFITPEGEAALPLGAVAFLNEATRRYREWDKQREKIPTDETLDSSESILEEVGSESSGLGLNVEKLQSEARDTISKAIETKSAYEFQDLAAALLRAMGYYTPFVAPRGKDGGVDIIAYKDPFGTELPQIKAQVKRKESTTPVKDIRELSGVLKSGRDVGIFFSSSEFTADAKAAARDSQVHIELIDRERFIDLWVEHFEKMTDEDKGRLRLIPIYFVDPQS